MNKLKYLLCLLACCLPIVCVAADSTPAAEASKTKLVREFPLMKDALKLLGSSAEELFFRMKDGAVVVTNLEGKLLRTLQAREDGALVLEKPEALAVGKQWIYVVDGEQRQVVMFSLDGKYERRFGAKKSGFFGSGGEGALKKPVSVAYQNGIVYVLDRESKSILLFGSNGVFLNTLPIKPSSAGNLSKAQAEAFTLRDPVEIKLDVTGQIYVLDADGALVKVFSAEGEFIRALPWEGELLGFNVAQDGVYVLKKNDNTVQKYDFNNNVLYQFGGAGVASFSLVKERQIVLADADKGVVSVFVGEAGTPLEAIPSALSRVFTESVAQWPLNVKKMAWDHKDTLYALDADDNSIVLIRNGKVLPARIKLPELHPLALAVDDTGALWVLDEKNRVVKLDASGKIVFSFGAGAAVAAGGVAVQFKQVSDMVISASGKIYVADQSGGTVQVFSKKGELFNIIKELKEPIALAVDTQDGLYVLEKGNRYLTMLSDHGVLLGSLGKGPDNHPRTLNKPLALMANAREVFVLDGNLVKVYASKGDYLRSFAAAGKKAGELDEPIAIARQDEVGFFIAEAANKRIQSFVTQYKPVAPSNLQAKGDLHAIDLTWDALALPYVKQYQVYRSKTANAGFVKVGSVPTAHFMDLGLAPDGQFFYRVAAETELGYEGATSQPASAKALGYTPPALAAVEVKATPWKITLTWQAIESPLVTGYWVYRKDGSTLTKLAETVLPTFAENGLTPNKKYQYVIAAHSSDGTDAPPFNVDASTLPFSKAPLEIEVLKIRPIFANTYKLYEEDGVGMVRLTNNTDMPMEGVTLSFLLKDFMDFPTESKIDQLLPGKSIEIRLKAVFNNKVLTITEDTSVQAMLEASFFDNGRREVFNKTSTVSVYEKHKLLWDERGRYASFITPKDPPLMAFVRAIVTQYKTVKEDSQLAAVLFNALGVYGLTYLPDPTNPYQVTSGKADMVDYIQFPRETLERKSGDCDDLVAFYTAALESLSIATRVVEVPGHMFMMFSTGLKAEADGYTMDNMYVAYEGLLWIPVETTVMGSPFIKAWELGAANYYKWQNKGLTILHTQHEWEVYKPASLPESTWKPNEITAAMIDLRFPNEVGAMLKMIAQTKTRKYLQMIKKNPADAEAYLQVGIVIAKMGDREEALKYFDKVIALQPTNAAALNNRGNLMMMNDNPLEAQKSYRAAAEHHPEDPYIWINLAKAYKALKQVAEAKEAFLKAVSLNPAIKTQYKALGLELSNTL